MATLDVSSGQLRTIRLYGKLGAQFGRVHRFAVANAAEAVRAMCAMLPGFERHLTNAKDRNEGYAVFYGKRNLDEGQLWHPPGNEDIRIAPMLMGAKKQGVGQIIWGAVLVVAGAVLTYFGYGAVGGPMMKMGWAMMIGGVIQMLSPVPKGRGADDRPENKPGHVFNGPLNTQAQGHPVPVLYGELIVGSAVISAGIEVKSNVYTPTNTTPRGYAGGGNWRNGYVVQREA